MTESTCLVLMDSAAIVHIASIDLTMYHNLLDADL